MIELEGVCRSFEVGGETVHALEQVTLSIGRGDYLSVMGPSGSGKSTLLNLLGLLDQPDAGSYRFEGVEMTTLSERGRARFRRGKIGFVFQSFHLVPRLTAAQNVELPLVLAGMEPAERKARVAAILERLGLADRAEHRPAQLSGGQQQRVAIARAAVLEAPLLLADEPTGNLDSRSGAEVVEILERLNREGATLLVVTHDPEIGRRAPRRLRMRDGSIVADERDAA